jgi:glycosyltransferase involved in cell wall biosynthesis
VLTLVDYWWWCPRQTLLHGRGHTCPGDVGWRDCLACVAVDHDRAWLRWLGQSALARSALVPAAFFSAGFARGLHPREIGSWRSRSRMLKFVLERAQAIIVPSRTMEQRVRHTVGHDRIWFVPYGLDRAWVAERGADGPRVKRRNGGGLTLGYAGVLEPHKGLHVLLDALRRLIGTDLRLRVAGVCGSERYRLELLRRSEGLPVSFLGRLDDAELARFYSELDVLIVPSLWPENRPFVVLEALATGCPVIASDVPGIAEVLSDARCRFTPGSSADLAERLRDWQAARAARIGDSSARRIRDVLSTADEMVERTLAVYASAGAARLAG